RALRGDGAVGDGDAGAARARAAFARHPGGGGGVRARPGGAVYCRSKPTAVCGGAELSPPKRAGGISFGELAGCVRRSIARSFSARDIDASASTLKRAREIV